MKIFNLKYWLLVICVVSLTACSKESLEEEGTSDLVGVVTPETYSTIEVEVMDRVNDFRAGLGLPELESLNEISMQAGYHNSHMIENAEVCHDDFPSRYAALVNSVNAKAVSENVAYGYRTAEAVVNAWVKSDGHRKNMESNVTHFGISIKEDAEGKLYFTNIFVRK